MMNRDAVRHSIYWSFFRTTVSCTLALGLGLFFQVGVRSGAAQSAQDVRALNLDQPIERDLSGGQSHTYSIALDKGQFLHVVVEQRGIDVAVMLLGPDAKQIIEMDSPNGQQGPEPVSFVSEKEGSYRLEVRSLENGARPGRYEIKVVELRAARPEDRVRVEAEIALREARRLGAQGRGESLRAAIKKYEEALPLLRELGDRASEASVHNSIGMIYDLFRQPMKGLEWHQQALSIRIAIRDWNGEAESLNNIGTDYSALKQFDKAIDYFHRALTIKLELTDQRSQASIYNNLGETYQAKGDPEKALENYKQALQLWRQLKDRKGEGKTRGNMAITHRWLGENQKARDYFTQSLELSREAGDRHSQHVAMAYLGDVHGWLGDTQKALENYRQSLAYFHDLGDRLTETSLINSISIAYREAGDRQKALEYLNQALKIKEELNDRPGKALVLHNLGSFFYSVSDHQQALDRYHEALRIRVDIKDGNGQAETLSNLGVLYKDLGQYEKALSYYLQSLPLFQASGYKRGEANLLNSLGVVYREQRDFLKALEQYELALQMWRKMEDRAGEGLTLRNMGAMYRLDLGDARKAMEYYERALVLARSVNDRGGEAQAIEKIGSTWHALHDLKKAADHLSRALALHRELKDRRGEAEALYSLARVERDRGDLLQSRRHFEAALELGESSRANIVSRELRASFASTFHGFHADYVDLLMRMHKRDPSKEYARIALETHEQRLARSLLETLNESCVEIRPKTESPLLAAERDLALQLNAKAQAIQRSRRNPRVAEQTAVLQREFDLMEAELQQVRTQIRQQAPHYAGLTQPRPLSAIELRQALDADTLLLEYALGEERSYLWAVTPDEFTSYELPRRSEINKEAKTLYEFLAAKTADEAGRVSTDYQKAAASLGRMLLEPVASRLGRKRLVIVADGALQMIPFAALPEPVSGLGRGVAPAPLIVNHEIVYLPSASTLALLRRDLAGRKPAPKMVAALARPVFSENDYRFRQLVTSDRIDEAFLHGDARSEADAPGRRAAPGATGNARTDTHSRAVFLGGLHDPGRVALT